MFDYVVLYGALTSCAIAGALVAESKQRSVRTWACSFLFPLPALVIVCVLGSRRTG